MSGIAIVGCGKLADIVLEYLISRNINVVAIWNDRLEEAERTAERFGIEFYTSVLKDILVHQQVALVLVLSTPSTQIEKAIECLEYNKHVICSHSSGETPKSISEAINVSSHHSSLISGVGYGFRLLPLSRKIRESLFSGHIGKVRVVNVSIQCAPLINRGAQTYTWLHHHLTGGGALSLIGSHVIDAISYWRDGMRAIRVNCVNPQLVSRTSSMIPSNVFTSADDFCALWLEFVDGSLAHISINSLCHGFSFQVQVCGSNRYLLFSNGVLTGFSRNSKNVLFSDATMSDSQSDFSSPIYNSCLTKGFLSVLEQIRSMQDSSQDWSCSSHVPTFKDALYVTNVIEAARKSYADGRWVELRFMDSRTA